MRIRGPLLFLLASFVARSQTLKDTADTLQDIGKSAASWIPYFQQRDNIITAMTIVVIFLGAIGTVTALAKTDRIKWVTAAITAVITILTSVKAQVFHADQESFGALAAATSRTVQDLRRDLDNYQKAFQFAVARGKDDLGEEDGSVYRIAFKTDRENIEKIDARAQKLNVTIMSPRTVSASFRWPALTRVYAAPMQPARPPRFGPPNALVSTGIGACDTTYGAREYARFDGRRRLALQLEPGATGERLDSLIGSIDSSVSEPWSNLSAETNSQMAIHTVQVTINRVLADNARRRIKNEVRARPGFLGVLVVKPGITGHVQVGSPAIQRGFDGAFVFDLDVSEQGGAVRVQVTHIKTYDDSSPNSSRWSFDVLVNNQRAFSVPLRRLEDSGKPTTCRVAKDENLQNTVKLSKAGVGFELRIQGYKAKDY
jgi:hypothetical protein